MKKEKTATTTLDQSKPILLELAKQTAQSSINSWIDSVKEKGVENYDRLLSLPDIRDSYNETSNMKHHTDLLFATAYEFNRVSVDSINLAIMHLKNMKKLALKNNKNKVA